MRDTIVRAWLVPGTFSSLTSLWWYNLLRDDNISGTLGDIAPRFLLVPTLFLPRPFRSPSSSLAFSLTNILSLSLRLPRLLEILSSFSLPPLAAPLLSSLYHALFALVSLASNTTGAKLSFDALRIRFPAEFCGDKGSNPLPPPRSSTTLLLHALP